MRHVKFGITKSQLDTVVGIHPCAAEEFVTMRTPTRKGKSLAEGSVDAGVAKKAAKSCVRMSLIQEDSVRFGQVHFGQVGVRRLLVQHCVDETCHWWVPFPHQGWLSHTKDGFPTPRMAFPHQGCMCLQKTPSTLV